MVDPTPHYLPGTTDPSNRQRAEWVRPALDDFARRFHSGRTLDELGALYGKDRNAREVIQDFVSYTLHLAMAIGHSESEAADILLCAGISFSLDVRHERLHLDKLAESARAAGDPYPT